MATGSSKALSAATRAKQEVSVVTTITKQTKQSSHQSKHVNDAADETQVTYFFRLPPELRNDIYDLVAVAAAFEHFWKPKYVPGLLRVSRQIRAEFSRIYYHPKYFDAKLLQSYHEKKWATIANDLTLAALVQRRGGFRIIGRHGTVKLARENVKTTNQKARHTTAQDKLDLSGVAEPNKKQLQAVKLNVYHGYMTIGPEVKKYEVRQSYNLDIIRHTKTGPILLGREYRAFSMPKAWIKGADLQWKSMSELERKK